MAVRVGINGFGRIGRNFFRAQQSLGADVEIVAVNDLGDAATMAHLLKYDSVLGPFAGEVSLGDGVINAGGERDEDALRARSGRAAVGRARRRRRARVDRVLHQARGRAEAPRRGRQEGASSRRRPPIPTSPSSSASTTTATTRSSTTSSRTPRARRTASRRSPRCSTTLAGIESGFMTTIHAYTNDQVILDMPHKDLRRARAAAINLIPTSTGAAKAIGLVLPHLKGKLDGVAVRAPVPTGSLTDLVVTLGREVTAGGGRRRLPGCRCRAARRHPPVPARPDRLDRHPGLAVLVHLRREADDGARAQREGLRLVRQRVGLQLPARRPGREAPLR